MFNAVYAEPSEDHDDLANFINVCINLKTYFKIIYTSENLRQRCAYIHQAGRQKPRYSQLLASNEKIFKSVESLSEFRS